MANVSIKDIEDVQRELGIELTDEQKNTILDEFNRLVMDSAEGWADLIEILIVKQGLIKVLKDKNV
jgi:uncharacterized protein YpuA (DUF1002 family)